jgi:UDP-glucuronate 4-epimerase
MSVLITGVAGFIGFHLARRLLSEEIPVVGVDNLNPYYDVRLKQDRLNQLESHPLFQFQWLDLADRQATADLFQAKPWHGVVHLAAQAGVRYSIDNPLAYVDSNLVGFTHILEGCRHAQIPHLVYASSSSVYGANTKIPFATSDSVDHPVSLYAATKKANELMAHCYSHLYKIPTTGLRFFTVYGPWGRPDMAYFKFVRAIEAGQPIQVYNGGQMQRDFTYIDDIIEGVVRVLRHIPSGDPPYKLYNIGNHQPVHLDSFIQVIESALGKKAIKQFLPMQPGDVPVTYADVSDLVADVGFQPSTPITTGLQSFVDWYRNYYSLPQSASKATSLFPLPIPA